MKKYLVLIVAALVLSACGSKSGNTDASRPEATSTTEQQSAPTEVPKPSEQPSDEDAEPVGMTIEVAAAQYLEMVAPSNCALDEYNAAVDGIDDDDSYDAVAQQIQPKASAMSVAYITFFEDLSGADWPDEVQPIVDRLVAEVAGEASFWRNVADAPNELTLDSVFESMPEQGTAAAELRAKLKLPTNIDNQSESCT